MDLSIHHPKSGYHMATMERRRKKRSNSFTLKAVHRHLLPLLAFAASLLFLVLLFVATSPSSSPPPPSHSHSLSLHDRRLITSHPPPDCNCSTGSLGELGDIMLSLLPDDLAFTVFMPSPESFRRILRLQPNLEEEKEKETANNTYAVVSRVLGFSAIPRHLRSADVPLRKQARLLDSVSGLKLYALRDVHGALLVNGVRSECVDISKAQTVVHVMAGVIMDAEFEQSFSSHFDD